MILGEARKHNVSKINGFALKIMMLHICSDSTLQLNLSGVRVFPRRRYARRLFFGVENKTNRKNMFA